MANIPFLFFSYLRPLAWKLQLYIPESVTLLNCQCNIRWPCITIIIDAFYKKDCRYRNNGVVRLDNANLERSITKEKNRCPFVLLPIFMFLDSNFSFRNLKDPNSCMISWCTTTNSVLICSRHDITPSQFTQYLQ